MVRHKPGIKPLALCERVSMQPYSGTHAYQETQSVLSLCIYGRNLHYAAYEFKTGIESRPDHHCSPCLLSVGCQYQAYTASSDRLTDERGIAQDLEGQSGIPTFACRNYEPQNGKPVRMACLK